MSHADETSFRVMRDLEKRPDMSQREMAQSARVSLGAINYCLRALQDKGFLKVRNFRASDNKLRYAYILTPHGLAEKAVLMHRFLDRKLLEYSALQAEIELIRQEMTDLVTDTDSRAGSSEGLSGEQFQ